ncbi:MAG: sialidase family protein, partial [Spirochaetota bacterium]|nr:sialidase family protein [Spirochaetota bacterium]
MRKQLSITKFIFFFISILLIVPGITLLAEETYWENPEVLIKRNVWFPLTASSSGLSVILWQEFNEKNGDSGQFSISILVQSGKNNWVRHEEVLGPFPFTGDKVSVSSLAVNTRGTIFVAITNAEKGILLYSSEDKGESFSLLGTPGRGEGATVSPKLFLTDRDTFVLFVTQPLAGDPASFNQESTLGVTYSVSSDGRTWSEYLPLIPTFELSNIYLPFHVSTEGKEHVVFQASPSNSRFYHLYYISSDDRGRTWSSPTWITDISENSNRSVDFDNQRVFLKENNGNIYLSWERKLGNGNSLSYYGKLDYLNRRIDSFEHITGTSISTNSVNNPQIYIGKEKTIALWYNNIGQVVLAGKENSEWQGIDIPGQTAGGLSNFCRFLYLNNEMNIVWQSDTGGDSGLTILMPDKTVPDIKIYPVNYKSVPLNQDKYTVTWDLPSDSSGIAGFSYSLDRYENGASPARIMIRRRDERKNSFTVNSDGDWFVHVRAVDYAGNWSNTSTSKFTRDTTPPGNVTFNGMELDEDGYLVSNTATFSWEPPEGEAAAGYSYRLQYLSNADYDGPLSHFNIQNTPIRPVTSKLSYSIYNQDNGIWSFTVNSFDAVGNRGESETIYLRMNKYIPVTYITRLSAVQDDLGVITMSIFGRGFSVGGKISTIILDRDKKEPFD